MNKKRKNLITIIVSLICVFTLFVYLNDQKRDAELKLSDKEEGFSRLQSHFLQHVEMLSGRIKPETPLYSRNAPDSTIANLSAKGPRFGLYIERAQCEQCWERALAFLEKTVPNISYMPKPIILASGYNRCDLQLTLNRHKISYPVYLLDRPWEIEPLLAANQPFYFILETDGNMRAVLYPEDMYELIGEPYLNYVAKYCYPDSIAAVQSTSDIELINPEVDLGEVPMRKKRTVEVSIRNNGKGKCIIKSVQPTCNCVLVEGYPTAILPGETETIKVAFLSSTTGPIQRNVLVLVEGEKNPYIFKLKGKVI